MTLRCGQCDAPIPDLAPGFSLSTCRQCGATYHVGSQGEVRRLGGPDTSAAPQAPSSTQGRSRHVPPTLRLEEDKGLWRVGWDNTSLTPLLLPAVWIGLLVMIPLRTPQFLTLLREPVPLAIVGAMTLLLAYVGVAGSINITWLEVHGHELSIVTKPLPMPRSAIVDTRGLRSAFCHSYEHRLPRTGVTETRHCVSVRTQDGKVVRLVENLPHEQDAVWLTTFLSERLGLQDEGRP
jgi:hypothetical protein